MVFEAIDDDEFDDEAMEQGCCAALEKSPAKKYVHVIVMMLSLIQVIFTTTFCADGRSVAVLKDAPPRVFDCINSTRYSCVNFTMRDLLRWPYGIGTSYDAYHQWWHEFGKESIEVLHHDRNLQSEISYLAKTVNASQIFDGVIDHFNTEGIPYNPVSFLGCAKLEKLGRGVAAFSYIAVSCAGIQLMLSAVHNGCPDACNLKTASLALQLVIFVAYIILVCGMAAIFGKQWRCNNTYIPVITLSDHFSINYAVAMAVVCAMFPPFVTVVISLWVPDPPDPLPPDDDPMEGEEGEEMGDAPAEPGGAGEAALPPPGEEGEG